jgi:hypothetical protein
MVPTHGMVPLARHSPSKVTARYQVFPRFGADHWLNRGPADVAAEQGVARMSSDVLANGPELPDGPQLPKGRRRTAAAAAVLVAGGAVAGGILSGTLGASAATTSPSPSASASTPPSSSAPAPAAGLPKRLYGFLERGTITAVGTDSVTIKTATATTTYSVPSASILDKNGTATLSDLKVGDAVVFDTTTRGGTVISHLHAGTAIAGRGPVGFAGPGPGGSGPGGFGPRGRGPGGAGGPGAIRDGLLLTGTVTAVGTDTVTIKTATATTTYSVTSTSDIDKSGEAKLSDLKVGDAVTFDTTTQGGTVIGHLHSGNETLNRPAAPPSAPAGTGTSA